MRKQLLAGAGLLALMAVASGPALAAPPAPDPALSWTGFYLGAHWGGAWAHDPIIDPIFGSKLPALTDIDSKGWLGGFQAGANWQRGPWVGGLEVDISGTGIKGSSSAAGSATDFGLTLAGNATQTDKFDMLGSGRARLGYLPWPNVLLYGTGGVAWARIDQTLDATETISSGGLSEIFAASQSTPAWRYGWVAGLGLETRLGNSNWLGRVEYLHYDFGDSGVNAGTGLFTIQTSGPITVDAVRVGLSYQFGMIPGAAAWPGGSGLFDTKAPPPTAAPWTWSGFYVGAHAGYGWGHDPFDPTIDSSGALAGFQAGANWQKGAWVGGLEVDQSATEIKGTATDSFGAIYGDKFRLLGSARARLGYAVWPTTLLYGTGGLAWTDLDQTLVNTDGTVSATPTARFGWVAGVGAEKKIADTNWIGRIEYLHYDFGDSGSTSQIDTVGSVSTVVGGFSTGRVTVNVVRAGVSYKFGGDPSGAPDMFMAYKAPPMAPATWSGFYLGAHGGYGWGHDPFSTNEEIFTTPDVVLSNINSGGWLGGFQAGANWQMDRWVAGAEIDLSASGIKGSVAGSAVSGTTTETDSQTDKFDYLGSGRARLGFLPMQNLLLYGTGGLAWTRFVQSTDVVTMTPGITTETITSTPSWRWGWVAGAGAETRIAQTNWLARLEYLHYDFGSSGNMGETITFLGAPLGSYADTSGRLTVDAVRAGFDYQLQ